MKGGVALTISSGGIWMKRGKHIDSGLILTRICCQILILLMIHPKLSDPASGLVVSLSPTPCSN